MRSFVNILFRKTLTEEDSGGQLKYDASYCVNGAYLIVP